MKTQRILLFIASLITIGLHAEANANNFCAGNGRYIVTRKISVAANKDAFTTLQAASPEALSVQRSSPSATIVEQKNKGAQVRRNSCIAVKIAKRAQRLSARKLNRALLLYNANCLCDQAVTHLALPNDPMLSRQWGVNQSNNIDMNLPEAWDISTGSRDTVVAVIDTGIDFNHPDLAPNMWRNPGEIPGNGIDDDRNGYVDDIHGVNTIWEYWQTGNYSPMDDDGHGTHVAGTIGAVGNNNRGVAGVNWSVQLIGVKFLGPEGGYLSDAILAVDYVTDLKLRGVNIVASNNSWGGGGYSDALRNAIERQKNAGVLFVAAAGNNAIDLDWGWWASYPASYNNTNIIAVASLEKDGSVSNFSNRGRATVDIAAPGGAIDSTYPGDQYYTMSGTSMAAPHVTGALALLKSYAPNMTMDQLQTNLLNNARWARNLIGIVGTSGMVDAAAMLTAARNSGPVSPTPTPVPTRTPTPTPTATPTRTPTPSPTATPTPVPGFFSLSGRITNGGVAIANAKVTLQYGTTTVVTYATENGEYTFHNVWGPVNYTITVTKGGMSFTAQSSTLVRNTTLDLSGDWRDYRLGVVALNPQGTPIPGVTLNGGALGSATTNANGEASFTLRYGTDYSLAPSKAGYGFRVLGLRGELNGDTQRLLIGEPNEE